MILWGGADLYKTNRIGWAVPNHRNIDAYEEYKKKLELNLFLLIQSILNLHKSLKLIGLK